MHMQFEWRRIQSHLSTRGIDSSVAVSSSLHNNSNKDADKTE